jgi:hypothetical protein
VLLPAKVHQFRGIAVVLNGLARAVGLTLDARAPRQPLVLERIGSVHGLEGQDRGQDVLFGIDVRLARHGVFLDRVALDGLDLRNGVDVVEVDPKKGLRLAHGNINRGNAIVLRFGRHWTYPFGRNQTSQSVQHASLKSCQGVAP